MSRIVWAPPEIAIKYNLDPNGEWMLEEEIPEQWENLLEDLDGLKSDIVKDLINKTISGELKWEFAWRWFTGGFFFATFLAGKTETDFEYCTQIAWPPKEWGFIVIVTGKDLSYDSALDDENYAKVGMELWHLMEDLCVNPEYLNAEKEKIQKAKEEGKQYPDPQIGPT